MQERSPYGSPWAEAARDGLMLSLVTVGVTLLSHLVSEAPAVVGFLLWAIRLGASLFLLSRFIRRYTAARPEVSGFGYGVKVCLFSSVVCALFTFLLFEFVMPDAFGQNLEEALSRMGSQLPAGSTDALLALSDNFARYAGIGVFFWSWLFGIVSSAVIGSASRPSNPFEKASHDDEL